MQLVAFQVISSLVSDVIRYVCDSVKKAWSETGKAEKEGFMLSPVAVKEGSYRKRIAQD